MMTEFANTDTSPVKHIIVTRFNVRFSLKADTAADRMRAEPGWLSDRFRLFVAYCLPSVAAQSNQNFLWFIYLDDQTPMEFRRTIETTCQDFPNIKIIYCHHFSPERIKSDISEAFGRGPEWIVTTRLDNDDSIHKDFVDILHCNLRPNEPELLNFPVGIVFRRGRTYLFRQLHNPFLSLVERFEGAVTVYNAPHDDMPKFAKLRQLDAPPAWLQVVHGRNVSNKVRGYRIPVEEALRGFSAVPLFQSQPIRESRAGILIENLTFDTMRNMRDVGIDLAHSMLRLAKGK